MNPTIGCIIAIAGWYLLYPPATQKSGSDSHTPPKWVVDGSYSTAADCDQAHYDDLNALQGLAQNSRDFLQTQAGRCVAADDPRHGK